ARTSPWLRRGTLSSEFIKEGHAERGRVEDAHSGVFAFPNLAWTREQGLKYRYVLRDEFGYPVSRSGCGSRESLFDDRSRILLNRRTATIRLFLDYFIEDATASASAPPLPSHILQKHKVRPVILQKSTKLTQTFPVLLKSSHFHDAPVHRCEGSFE